MFLAYANSSLEEKTKTMLKIEKIITEISENNVKSVIVISNKAY